MTRAGYYRHPTIHGETVLFVSEDDLWGVEATGGPARRLTSGRGPARYPHLSPDGRHVAFSGSEEGVQEVYLTDAAGGPVRRLTHLGSEAQVVGWSGDGQDILFSSTVGQPFRPPWLFAVAAAGGPTRRQPLLSATLPAPMPPPRPYCPIFNRFRGMIAPWMKTNCLSPGL